MVAEPGSSGDDASWTSSDQEEFNAENGKYNQICNLNVEGYVDHFKKIQCASLEGVRIIPAKHPNSEIKNSMWINARRLPVEHCLMVHSVYIT